MLSRMMTHAEDALAAPDGEAASERFFAGARALGATYLQTRVYRRPPGRLTSQSHWAAGGLIRRIGKPDWPGSAGFNYICFDCNPLLAAIREGRTCYRFSDFAPRGARAFGAYWEAFSEAGIADALCATSYGADGAIASIHLGFGDADLPPADAQAVQLAGLVLTEWLLSRVHLPPASPVRLTTRERDALALVAEGKTDWEISVILSVAEATARFHVDNARRKLGAVNRAQAVARLVGERMI